MDWHGVWEVIRGRARIAYGPAPGEFDAGDVAGLNQQISAIRRGDGHTVIRWAIRKAWGDVLTCDVRAEHARLYAAAWMEAADKVDQADPLQDWSVDPIRDSWSGGPVDPRWFDVVEVL